MRKYFAKLAIPVLFCMVFSGASNGQDRALTGKVTTFDSIPLFGAEVNVKSTGITVKTDTAGLFSVLCNNEDKITVEADGFFPRKVKVGKDIRLLLVKSGVEKRR